MQAGVCVCTLGQCGEAVGCGQTSTDIVDEIQSSRGRLFDLDSSAVGFHLSTGMEGGSCWENSGGGLLCSLKTLEARTGRTHDH